MYTHPARRSPEGSGWEQPGRAALKGRATVDRFAGLTACAGTGRRSIFDRPFRRTLRRWFWNNDEIAPAGGHSGARRSRTAAQPGAPAPPPEAARLRHDAGDDFARHQGARAGEARRRRRVSAARPRDGESRNGAHRARARRGRVRPCDRPRPAARDRSDRAGPGADTRLCARSRPAAGGRGHHRRRRYDSRDRARRAWGGRARPTIEGLLIVMTNSRGTSARDRIVLAFAGDLESSIAVPWLAETEDAEIVAVTLDFGQSRDLEGIRDRALTLGAVRAHVLDARAEFARDYLLPALKAGALDDRGRRLAAALGHAAIARALVEIAEIEQAVRVAHGGITSAARLTAAVQSLKPDVTVLAPVREWSGGR